MSDLLRNGRQETIRRAAFRLADSGAFADWQSIEVALCRRYGVLAAHRLLVDRAVRAELTSRCTAAIARLAGEDQEVTPRHR
ncbi:hypothetical protein [Paraburkholderia adhaesiva]|uniref:hypothetical protein n=1 Tax=Paraburkholderia adhaesiva TaxID=2883244 RepID=UPI001F186350|nr:hypothetical protein [Paraburkholderia adhaesiva]